MKKGFNYNLVNYFINNTHLTVLLLVLVIFTGIFGFSNLRTEGFPEIQVPLVIVSTVTPGAGPEAIMDSVTAPLESALKDIEGVQDISSSSQRNYSSLVVTLKEGVDINDKVEEIRNKVDTVDLPEGTQDSLVFVPATGGPTYIIAATGDYSIAELLNLESIDEFKNELLDLDGVKAVEKISNVSENIYIDVNPIYNSPEIVNQIKTSNITFPLGELIVDGSRIGISGKSVTQSLEDFSNLPISVNGKIFKLSDIAEVYTQLNYGGQIHRVGYTNDDGEFDVKGAIFYEIELESDADIIKLDGKIKNTITYISGFSSKLDYEIVFNQGEQTKAQIDEIIHGAFGSKWGSGPLANFGYLFGGIWLLMIVILLFLDWRSALISIFAIPLSFLITFAALNVMGYQLNTIVLFSLILVLGLIVDPAIVVLESLKRYVELGYEPKEAALKAVHTVGGGIFIAVLTSFVVFMPFAVVSGVFGQIIKYIPFTVIPALIASYFVPMIFLTWIGSKIFKSKGYQNIANEDDPQYLWRASRSFISLNRYILNRKWLQIGVVLLSFILPVIIAGGLFASGTVKQVQFSQPDDVQFLAVSVPREIDMTNAQLLDLALDTEEIIQKYDDEVQRFFYSAVGGLDFGGHGTLSMFVELKPFDERDMKSNAIAKDLQADLVKKFGTGATASESGEGPPEGTYPVSISIFNTDGTLLASASEKIAEQLVTYEEVIDVRYDGQESTKELSVQVDKEVAAKYGLNAPAVFGQINGLLGETTLFTIDDSKIIFRVAEDKKPDTVEKLENTLIFSPKGAIALKNIADIIEEEVPQAIKRFDGKRYQSISASITDSKDVIEIQRRIDDWAKENVSELGLSEKDFGKTSGGIDFEKSFEQLFIAIYLSIFITYLIFVIFFRSFIQPFIILLTLPLMFIGLFPAIAIFAGGQFGFLETLGIIMLIGIVENVGIFMIDFANQKVKEGMDKKEAITLSSGVRFRPILLTQLTSLTGLLPLAMFSPFWRGLAVVVVSGIIASGALALIVTPILYVWFTRTKKVAPTLNFK